MLIRSFGCLMATTSAAFAACGANQDTFLSCSIADRDTVLEVCFDAETAHYSYGPIDHPELTLQEPVATLDYRPWPGVGSAIWEEVTFRSGPYGYTVTNGYLRQTDDAADPIEPPFFGGVLVERGQTSLADLSCDPTTVEFGSVEGLWGAKQALGQTWDHLERRWRDLPD